MWTGKGDDGSTGLYFGGRVGKDDAAVEAYGTLDEAQAFIGLARAEVDRGSELDEALIALERDLWVVMAELATAPDNHRKLEDGKTRTSNAMVERLEREIDRYEAQLGKLDFAVPGQDRLSALLDVARAVVRRAERHTINVATPESRVLPYLNRLSSLLWTMARWVETDTLLAKTAPPTKDV